MVCSVVKENGSAFLQPLRTSSSVMMESSEAGISGLGHSAQATTMSTTRKPPNAIATRLFITSNPLRLGGTGDASVFLPGPCSSALADNAPACSRGAFNGDSRPQGPIGKARARLWHQAPGRSHATRILMLELKSVCEKVGLLLRLIEPFIDPVTVTLLQFIPHRRG